MTPRLSIILDALGSREGAARAISARDLSRATGIPQRTIRREIEAALADGTLEELGIPLCASSRGYFLGRDMDEFQHWLDVQRSLALALATKIDGIVRLAHSLGLHLSASPRPRVES